MVHQDSLCENPIIRHSSEPRCGWKTQNRGQIQSCLDCHHEQRLENPARIHFDWTWFVQYAASRFCMFCFRKVEWRSMQWMTKQPQDVLALLFRYVARQLLQTRKLVNNEIVSNMPAKTLWVHGRVSNNSVTLTRNMNGHGVQWTDARMQRKSLK